MKLWVGGITVLLEEDYAGRCIPLKKEDEFVDALFRLPEVRTVEGPLINCIWAVTFHIAKRRPYKYYSRLVGDVWKRFATQRVSALERYAKEAKKNE